MDIAMFRFPLLNTTIFCIVILLMLGSCSILQMEETYLFIPKVVSAPEKKLPPPQKIQPTKKPEKEVERETENELEKVQEQKEEEAEKLEEVEKPKLFIPKVIPPGKKISRLPYKSRRYGLVVPFIDLCLEAEQEEKPKKIDWGSITPWLFKDSDGE